MWETMNTPDTEVKSPKKQWLLLFLLLLPTFYLLVTGRISTTVQSYINAQKQISVGKQLFNTLQLQHLPSSNIEVYTDTSTTWETAKDTITVILDILPQKITKDFEENKWKLAIIDAPTDKQQKFIGKLVDYGTQQEDLNYFSGLTVPAGKFIIVYLHNYDMTFNAEKFQRVVTHEFGHYFETQYMTKQQKNEWQKVFKVASTAERWVAVDSSECLAEIFADTIIDGRALYTDKEVDAYDYIRKLVFNIRD